MGIQHYISFYFSGLAKIQMFLLLKCQQTLKLRTHFEYALDFAPDPSTPYKTNEESGWGGVAGS